MPPNRFESEVGNFLEGSHGDRTHIKRAGHHTVTPLCGTLLAQTPTCPRAVTPGIVSKRCPALVRQFISTVFHHSILRFGFHAPGICRDSTFSDDDNKALTSVATPAQTLPHIGQYKPFG